MAVAMLIDPDILQARLIKENLATIGCSVLWAAEGWEGLVVANRVRPDLIIVDCATAQSLELLILLRALRGLARVPILLIGDDRPAHYHLRKLGVADCVEKPLDAECFVTLVQHISPRLRQIPAQGTTSESGRLLRKRIGVKHHTM